MKQSILAIAVALATVISLAAFPTLIGIKTIAQQSPPHATQLPANIGNMSNPVETTTSHLPVKTVQDDHFIVTTVTKSGEPPTGPIIVIPPEPGKPGNGTIITPGENITTGNETNPANPGNITIIEPGGNVTEIPGNVTNVGNDTVIIAPPDRNITETPGNVTVIDPEPPHQLPPANCTCAQNNQTQQPPATIPPVIVTPAPGQNITTVPPVLNQPPSGGSNQTQPIGNNESATGQPQPLPPTPPAGNETTGGSGNQTGNTGGNETQTPPVNNATNSGNQNNSTNTEPPHATQLPATLTIPFLPGVHISQISYSGVNNQYLNK